MWPPKALHIDLANSMTPRVPIPLPLPLLSLPPPLADTSMGISTPLGISLLSSYHFARSFFNEMGAVFSQPIDVYHDSTLGAQPLSRNEAFWQWGSVSKAGSADTETSQAVSPHKVHLGRGFLWQSPFCKELQSGVWNHLMGWIPPTSQLLSWPKTLCFNLKMSRMNNNTCHA